MDVFSFAVSFLTRGSERQLWCEELSEPVTCDWDRKYVSTCHGASQGCCLFLVDAQALVQGCDNASGQGQSLRLLA